MLQRLSAIVVAFAVLSLGSPAFARGHGGGHHSSSGRTYGFRTSKCKSASCFRKHPNGTYVHPLTKRKHR